ncbi:uncharacterized protein K452DRAFT_310692 [Aplosporella prunicola CBS 121167]|uniref:CCHC-type domain-containing protein n=1 Tax=Aplosporella prunicola CBS 121167 TaxID=1176127 RepID=A0A6A6B5C4_9PEZI|nr:uncharacterized protein K452DRAFT_310692 [Aplosporella prunicola CBS 121167]KAF2139240.1 hypothetical protein K452DRAFT_310692 [Aplosporella prunicola CBS 121167]
MARYKNHGKRGNGNNNGYQGNQGNKGNQDYRGNNNYRGNKNKRGHQNNYGNQNNHNNRGNNKSKNRGGTYEKGQWYDEFGNKRGSKGNKHNGKKLCDRCGADDHEIHDCKAPREEALAYSDYRRDRSSFQCPYCRSKDHLPSRCKSEDALESRAIQDGFSKVQTMHRSNMPNNDTFNRHMPPDWCRFCKRKGHAHEDCPEKHKWITDLWNEIERSMRELPYCSVCRDLNHRMFTESSFDYTECPYLAQVKQKVALFKDRVMEEEHNWLDADFGDGIKLPGRPFFCAYCEHFTYGYHKCPGPDSNGQDIFGGLAAGVYGGRLPYAHVDALRKSDEKRLLDQKLSMAMAPEVDRRCPKCHSAVPPTVLSGHPGQKILVTCTTPGCGQGIALETEGILKSNKRKRSRDGYSSSSSSSSSSNSSSSGSGSDRIYTKKRKTKKRISTPKLDAAAIAAGLEIPKFEFYGKHSSKKIRAAKREFMTRNLLDEPWNAWTATPSSDGRSLHYRHKTGYSTLFNAKQKQYILPWDLNLAHGNHLPCLPPMRLAFSAADQQARKDTGCPTFQARAGLIPACGGCGIYGIVADAEMDVVMSGTADDDCDGSLAGAGLGTVLWRWQGPDGIGMARYVRDCLCNKVLMVGRGSGLLWQPLENANL